jgi:hypothetical protein
MDAGADAGDSGAGDPVPLTAVDLLVVVDDSMDMAEEQQILGENLFAFIDSLMHPPSSSSDTAIDDLRIAAVTSNMGISSDGVNNDEYWPVTPGPPGCVGFGDDGEFQGGEADSIDLPDGGTVGCTAITGQWSETTADEENADLAAQAACLASLGTDGCGVEQHLASAERALTREDQTDFLRDNAVLAVIAIGGEDDGSLKDGQGMFALFETSSTGMDVMCGVHPEYCFEPIHFYEAFTGARGRADAVLFATIAGVPWAEEDPVGAAACQGPGDQIGECLDQEAMQLAPADGWPGAVPVCSRSVGSVQVTVVPPGRRFVELATEFGANGYVYSICNADWTPAFDAIGAMIRGKLAP